ncbi:winged helix-turn-helix domain-containing protein [Schauerella aestuarii]|uniref:winged helix-turn-helix domain-containing protein n=1 Tax=Schauerella aestuarii TaxID=2511204 RepID=UPI001F1FEA58|nr:winged helix-turn-helix domain-containing protein [Achromobacter aestuarii]
MDTPCVALLDTDETLRINTAHGLSAQGLHVYGCRDLAALYNVINQRPTHAVLLRRAPETAALIDVLLPQLRANYSMSIVVDSIDCSADERLHALQAGADLCLDHAYDMRELAALLRAQTRGRAWPRPVGSHDPNVEHDAGRHEAGRFFEGLPRLAQEIYRGGELAERAFDMDGRGSDRDARTHDDGARRFDHDLRARNGATIGSALGSGGGRKVTADDNRGQWWVRFQGWVLVPPQGAPINLTGVERAFFQALLSDPGRELSREALVRSAAGCQVKSISVAISRLRKKVRASGLRLPLHTVHGMGYVFIGRLVQDDTGGG